jgi:hypothetical protein
LAKATELRPEERAARLYADRLILEKLTELHEVFKPSEIADLLRDSGLGLSAVRSLLASNAEIFAYHERRWVPAVRVDAANRPFAEYIRLFSQRYAAPIALDLLAMEASVAFAREEMWCERSIERLTRTEPDLLLTRDRAVVNRSIVFAACDETVADACLLNGITQTEIEEVEGRLGTFDWKAPDAIMTALEKLAPVSAKGLMGAAWKALNPQDPYASHLFDWKEFGGELFAIPGFVYGADGVIHPETAAKKWITTAVRLAEKIAPSIEVEDAAPLELKSEDIDNMASEIVASDATVTATSLLESLFEITSNVKTFPDDMANVMAALRKRQDVAWVGGDRFQKPKQHPEFVEEVPAPFEFVASPALNEEGDLFDAELVDEGLSTSLRKLIVHPLAMDVLDEDLSPTGRQVPESLRLVLKPIHRELGTFPMSQIPSGWFGEEPNIQEVILIDPQGEELQIWINHKARLMFNLFDWWLDQPVESGAVFSLSKTPRPNVFEFRWMDQPDPVVYISNQRMEGLREIASEAEELTTFEILCKVMEHWPKGTDFLTLLWEINVVRRTSRRLLASLLSSYVCFYQRSGSPVWHYDHKKVEAGFDKSKKKFIKKD